MPARDSLSSTAGAGSPATVPADGERDSNVVQSIPPWVHVNDSSSEEQQLLQPSPVVPNTRHYKPPPRNASNAEEHPPPPQHYRPGRKWDHLRSSEPALPGRDLTQNQGRWIPFMSSGPNPVEGDRYAGSRIMDDEWMREHMPGVMRGWAPGDDENEWDEKERAQGPWLLSPEFQERAVRLFWRLLLKNPFVPLVFRLAVLAFSAAAIGISAMVYEGIYKINHDDNPLTNCAPRASTYMALIVGSVAVPYVCYVTRDEYTSRPLGLRSVYAKTSLLLCDLYFIVFSASNLSLAFDALFDHRWACYDEQSVSTTMTTCPNNSGICYKQRALAGVLLVSLLAWLITFSISVIRVVEKLRV